MNLPDRCRCVIILHYPKGTGRSLPDFYRRESFRIYDLKIAEICLGCCVTEGWTLSMCKYFRLCVGNILSLLQTLLLFHSEHLYEPLWFGHCLE